MSSRRQYKQLETWFPVLITVVGAGLYLINIGDISLFGLDEVKNATCARDMMLSENVIVPKWGEVYRTDKPPLHYYFMMLGYQLFGINEFGARFFSSIMGILTLLCTFHAARYLKGLKIARITSLLLLTNIHFSFEFHLSVPDPYLIFFLTASLFSLLIYLKNRRITFFFLTYIMTGFAVLSKGPIAVVIPLMTLTVYALIRKENILKLFNQVKIFEGAALVILISFPWFITVGYLTDGVWLQGFLFDHNVQRFSSTLEEHRNFVILPIVLILLTFAPYSGIIFKRVKHSFRNADMVLAFSLAVVLVVLGIFTLSRTFLPNYILPAYPFFAFVLAQLIQNRIKIIESSSIIYGSVLLIVSIVLTFIYLESNYGIFLPYIFVLSVFFGLIWLVSKRNIPFTKSLFIATFFNLLLQLAVFTHLFESIDRTNRNIVDYVSSQSEKELIIFRKFKTSLPFYLDQKIHTMHGTKWFETYMSYESKNDILVLTRSEYMEVIGHIEGLEIIRTFDDIFDGKQYVVLKFNRPI